MIDQLVEKEDVQILLTLDFGPFDFHDTLKQNKSKRQGDVSRDREPCCQVLNQTQPVSRSRW